MPRACRIPKPPKVPEESSIIRSSKRQSLMLAKRLAKLPQELRDIIWGYYWLAPCPRYEHCSFELTQLYEGIHVIGERGGYRYPTPQRCICYTPQELPTAVLPAYVGNYLAHDAARAGFAFLRWFEGASQWTLWAEHLEKWLCLESGGPIHVGITPDYALRKLRLVYMPRVEHIWDATERRIATKALQKRLRAITQLRPSANLIVTLVIQNFSRPHRARLVDVTRTLETFKDVVFEALRKGVELWIEIEWPVEAMPRIMASHYFYSIYQEVWKKRVEANNHTQSRKGRGGTIPRSPRSMQIS